MKAGDYTVQWSIEDVESSERPSGPGAHPSFDAEDESTLARRDGLGRLLVSDDDPIGKWAEEMRLRREEQWETERQHQIDVATSLLPVPLDTKVLYGLLGASTIVGGFELGIGASALWSGGGATAGLRAGAILEAQTVKFGVVNTLKVIRSASQMNPAKKALTVVGHAIDKHAGRLGSPFGKVGGNPAARNALGMKLLKEIMRAPGRFYRVTSKGRTFLEKRLADGRGVRLNRDFTFKGFLD